MVDHAGGIASAGENDRPVSESVGSLSHRCGTILTEVVGVDGWEAHDECGAAARNDVLDVLARFRVWTGNIGAYHGPADERSLEHRLRRTPELIQGVKDLLQELHETTGNIKLILQGVCPNFEFDTETDGDEHPLRRTRLQDLCQICGDIVTNLFELSALLSKATVRDRYARAAAAGKDYPFDPGSDVRHVKDLFPKVQSTPWLATRLGHAITRRREFLRYSAEHRRKLGAEELNGRLVELQAAEPTTKKDQSGKDIVSAPHSLALKSKNAATTATTVERKAIAGIHVGNLGVVDENDQASETTSFESTMSGGSEKLKVTSLDELSAGRLPFECPYCRAIQSFTKPAEWKKHVFHDLRAYVCTFKDCTEGLFQSRAAWFQHELSVHRRAWVCLSCSDKVYSSADRLVKHLRDSHEPMMLQINETVLQSVLEASSRPLKEVFSSSCPLCDTWQERREAPEQTLSKAPAASLMVSISEFKRHLGGHMEQLAISAIPNTVDDDPPKPLSNFLPDERTRGIGATTHSDNSETHVDVEQDAITVDSEVSLPSRGRALLDPAHDVAEGSGSNDSTPHDDATHIARSVPFQRARVRVSHRPIGATKRILQRFSKVMTKLLQRYQQALKSPNGTRATQFLPGNGAMEIFVDPEVRSLVKELFVLSVDYWRREGRGFWRRLRPSLRNEQDEDAAAEFYSQILSSPSQNLAVDDGRVKVFACLVLGGVELSSEAWRRFVHQVHEPTTEIERLSDRCFDFFTTMEQIGRWFGNEKAVNVKIYFSHKAVYPYFINGSRRTIPQDAIMPYLKEEAINVNSGSNLGVFSVEIDTPNAYGMPAGPIARKDIKRSDDYVVDRRLENQKLTHSHVRKLYGIANSKDRTHIFMEAADYSLQEYMLRDRIPGVSLKAKIESFEELMGPAHALMTMHHNQICDSATTRQKPTRFGDIRAENIVRVTDNDGRAVLKLSDFGDCSIGFVDHLTYCPPEFLGNLISRQSKTIGGDVWSFGCLAFEWLVWLIDGMGRDHGRTGLRAFKRLRQNAPASALGQPRNDRFFVIDSQAAVTTGSALERSEQSGDFHVFIRTPDRDVALIMTLNPAIEAYIERVCNDEDRPRRERAFIRDLSTVMKEIALVPNPAQRGTMLDFYNALKQVLAEAQATSTSLIEATLCYPLSTTTTADALDPHHRGTSRVHNGGPRTTAPSPRPHRPELCRNVQITERLQTASLCSGCCEVPASDFGNHAIAAEVTKDFLDFTARQRNDFRSIGAVKGGCKWCLCASGWLEAFEARGREKDGDEAVLKIFLNATKEKALGNINIDDLKAFAVDKEQQ